jgi:hypothetical protein
MEPARFDALVQTLPGPGSRRRALSLLLASALAPMTTAAKPAPAASLATGLVNADHGPVVDVGAGLGPVLGYGMAPLAATGFFWLLDRVVPNAGQRRRQSLRRGVRAGLAAGSPGWPPSPRSCCSAPISMPDIAVAPRVAVAMRTP